MGSSGIGTMMSGTMMSGWIAYSDMKPWLDIDDVAVADPSAAKELQELYAAFDQKVRTFREAREAVHAKGKNRGYYLGGKSTNAKGRGKKGGKKGNPSPVMNVQSTGLKGKGMSTSPVNKPGYSGCFICGDKGHDFRNCPRRGQQQSASSSSSLGRSRMIGMVSCVDDEPVYPSRPPAQDLQHLVLAASSTTDDCHRLEYAVIDTGATETVGSLEAVEQIMKTRFAVFGQERIGLDVNKNNRFKFGNAQERSAECYLLLPQVIKGQSTQLGVYTLDVPGVPILLGVAKPSLISTKHFPGIEIS
jgi:hypothetical protein